VLRAFFFFDAPSFVLISSANPSRNVSPLFTFYLFGLVLIGGTLRNLSAPISLPAFFLCLFWIFRHLRLKDNFLVTPCPFVVSCMRLVGLA